VRMSLQENEARGERRGVGVDDGRGIKIKKTQKQS
jgi:hypothetical protein